MKDLPESVCSFLNTCVRGLPQRPHGKEAEQRHEE
jgi:hypothetical protein